MAPIKSGLAIHYVAASELIPYAKNARTHSDAQIEVLAASLREFGWTNPVLLDGENGIIAGHGRLLAAAKVWEAGEEIRGCEHGKAPCIDVAWLTPAQRRAYVLADNQLALRSGWDDDVLGAELRDLKLGGFEIDVLGFKLPDLNKLLTGATGGRTGEDDAPPAPVAPVAQAGDLWLLGAHRLLCGDATNTQDVQRAVANSMPGLMVTDPPYGVNYEAGWRTGARLQGRTARTGVVKNDDRADWRDAWALFHGDVAYVWHSGLHALEVQESIEACGFAVRAQIIWAKDQLAISRGDYHWQHEPCFYAVRKGGTGHWAGDRKQSTLWSISRRGQDTETVHGTQKPVECMRRPILNNSMPGEVIYEPFCGSGTTIIACEDTGRTCVALELDPAYVDVAIRRWEAFTGRQATLEGARQVTATAQPPGVVTTQPTFAKVAEARGVAQATPEATPA